MCVFGVYLDQILSLKISKITIFLYKICKNYHFFNKNFKKLLFFYVKSNILDTRLHWGNSRKKTFGSVHD